MGEIELYFDGVIGNKIFGWASRRGTAETADHIIEIAVSLCGLMIGKIARNTHRPDVDEYVGYGLTRKGFEIRLDPLAAFALSSKIGGWPAITVGATDNFSQIFHIPDTLQVLNNTILGLTSRDWNGPNLSDIWFSTSSTLQLRFEDEHSSPRTYTIEVYQALSHGANAQIHKCGAAALSSRLDILKFSIVRPMYPILIVALNENGQIESMGCVPYPSLCRGGIHHIELRALANQDCELSDLENISARLLRVNQDACKSDTALVDKIEVDIAHATGNEIIFSANFLDWLKDVVGTPIHISENSKSDSALFHYLDGKIAKYREIQVTQSPDRNFSSGKSDGIGYKNEDDSTESLSVGLSERQSSAGELLCQNNEMETHGVSRSLLLPSDAVPTLSALLNPKSKPSCRPSGRGSHLVVGVDYQAAFWEIFPSSMRCPDVQHDITPSIVEYGLDRSCVSNNCNIDFPIAIRSPAPSTAVPRSALYPHLIYNKQNLSAENLPFSACIALSGQDVTSAPLIETLHAQSNQPEEIIVAYRRDALSSIHEEVRYLLERYFSGRYRIVSSSFRDKTSLFDSAAEESTCENLLFLDARVRLHDSRTVDVLSSLLSQENVGTSSVLTLEDSREQLTFYNAGYFLNSIDFGTESVWRFAAHDTRYILGNKIYPVLANQGELLAIRKSILKEVGGFGRSDPGENWAVKFGLRLLDSGYVNLCTNVISAFLSPTDGAPSSKDDIVLRADLQKLATTLPFMTHIRRVRS